MQSTGRWPLGATLRLASPFVGPLLLPLLLAADAAAGCVSGPVCQFLACRSPASGVPVFLWGDLEPVDAGVLPANRDSTDFDEFADLPSLAFPHWTSLDIENG